VANTLTLLTATVAPLNVQHVATSIEANLPYSQTNIQLAMLDVSPNAAVTQSLNVDSSVASDSTVLDQRSVHRAMVPSLRVERGELRLPDNTLDMILHQGGAHETTAPGAASRT
jgi:hypothetical protein